MWQRTVPASAVTVDTEGLTASFTMPVGPPAGGRVGVVIITRAGQAEGTQVFTYTVPPPPRPPTVSAVTPTGGPAGTVVTLHGTGLQSTGLRVVVQSGMPFFHRVVDASTLTFSSTGTEVSFAMPDAPAQVGQVGVIVMTPSGRVANVPLPSTPRRRRRGSVADEGAALPSTGTSSPVLFAVAMGVLVVGWALFVLAMRRRTRS